MGDFPWYNVLESVELEQGDFFHRCPVLEPEWDAEAWERDEGFKLKGPVAFHSVVIMSQSCDLTHDKLTAAIVCPFLPVEDFLDANFPNANTKDKARTKEAIRRGHLPGYHMLAPCDIEGFECGIQVVSFHQIYSVPLSMLRHMAATGGRRLRLLPPYREHLGQAFARYFMRIGLPIDIPNQRS